MSQNHFAHNFYGSTVTTGEKLPHLIEEDEPTYSCLYSVWRTVITDVAIHFSKLMSRGMVFLHCVTGVGAGLQVGGRGLQPEARRGAKVFFGGDVINCR